MQRIILSLSKINNYIQEQNTLVITISIIYKKEIMNDFLK